MIKRAWCVLTRVTRGGPRPGTPGAGRFPGRKPGAARRRPRRATPSTGGSGVGERRITIDDVKAKKTLPTATPAFQGLRVHNGRGEILNFPDTPTTQGLSLWCFNTVGGEILTFPGHSHYSGVIPMVFQHSGGRDFDLPRHSHYSGVIPMVFQHSERWAKKTLVQLEGKQGERGPDFDDDGYKYMICVEPAVARPSAPVELAIGESWTEGELLWSFSRELTKSLHEDVMDTCTSMISCGRGCGAFASVARK